MTDSGWGLLIDSEWELVTRKTKHIRGWELLVLPPYLLGGSWDWKLSYKSSWTIKFQGLLCWGMPRCPGKVAHMERPWKLCTYPHSTPSPIHLSCWVVPGLHPLIIKLVVITVALSWVLWVIFENYQIWGAGGWHENLWICSQPGRSTGSFEVLFTGGIWNMSILVGLSPFTMESMLIAVSELNC